MDAILADILRDPTNDDLKTIYADQLQFAGDPLGELIVADMRASSDDDHADRAAARRRSAELRKKHGGQWWPWLPEHRVVTRLGFPTRLVVWRSELAAAANLIDVVTGRVNDAGRSSGADAR